DSRSDRGRTADPFVGACRRRRGARRSLGSGRPAARRQRARSCHRHAGDRRRRARRSAAGYRTPICARRVRSRPARRPHRRARQLARRRGSEPIKRTRGRACRNGICCRCRRARGDRACRSRSAAGRKSSRSKDSADVARQRAHLAMTEVNRAITSELLRPRVANAGLEVGPTDVLLAFMTFAGSLGVLLYGLSAIASFPIFLALHFVALAVPAAFVTRRARADGELTIPVLLLLATFASGPVGALGCAVLALALWWR